MAMAVAAMAIHTGCAFLAPVSSVISFHQLRVTSAQLGGGGIELHLGLDLIFRNFTGSEVTIPAHNLRFELGHPQQGQAPVQTSVAQAAVTLAADEREKIVRYPIDLGFSLSSLQPRVVFGTDAPYRFEIQPVGGLAGGFAQWLGQQVPEAASLLRYENTLRLPLPPEIASVQEGRMELLTDSAQLEPIDLAPIRTGLDGLLDAVAAAGTAILTVLPIDPEVLDDGVEAWGAFQALPTELALVPVTAVQGVRLSVPIRLRNPNDFPLRTPALAAGAFFGTPPEASSSAPPDQAIARILYPGPDASMLPPYDGSADTLVDTDLLMEVRWSNGGQGLAAFLGGGSPSSSYLDAVLELDLGYGTIQVPFRAAVPNLLLVQ